VVLTRLNDHSHYRDSFRVNTINPLLMMLIQATNDESAEINVAYDPLANRDEEKSDTIPKMAQRCKARGQQWALVVDENYGEGSAREHAALQPRFYGTRSHE
jgi:aconitase A